MIIKNPEYFGLTWPKTIVGGLLFGIGLGIGEGILKWLFS
jgi:uncharacterized membrane protein YedE/YeeE